MALLRTISLCCIGRQQRLILLLDVLFHQPGDGSSDLALNHGNNLVMDFSLVSQLNLTLGRVDVEIDQGGIYIDEEIAIGKRPAGEQFPISVGNSLHQ
ncbi:hypothetical protein SDC9_129208 [bioreactor metagenome]|uniref:Uncharacterized protein n=1 Tax=bioreactor metagenome TaxID=1076179 RepID=A0A645CYZ9_9ZZZZ